MAALQNKFMEVSIPGPAGDLVCALDASRWKAGVGPKFALVTGLWIRTKIGSDSAPKLIIRPHKQNWRQHAKRSLY